MRGHELAIPAAVAMLFAGCLPAISDEPARDALAARGKAIFHDTAGGIGCAACHGADARGLGVAPDIRTADEDRIRDGLRHVGDMRGFGLTPEDVAAVAAYLAFMRKPRS